MNTKTVLIILAIMIGIIMIFGFKVMSPGNNSSVNEISLSTQPDPLQPGPATFMIDVKDKSGKPVDNAKVFFDLNMTNMNMGTQRGDAVAQGNGLYSAMGRITMRGPWRVSTKITMPDGNIENRDFIVNVL